MRLHGVQPMVPGQAFVGLERLEQLESLGRPGRDADVCLDGAAVDFECIDPLQQLQPKEVTPLGRGDPNAGGKMFGDGAKRGRLPAGVTTTQPKNPPR